MVLSRTASAKTQRATLIGTLVSGPACCAKNIGRRDNLIDLVAQSAQYTRIDHHIGWIRNVMGTKFPN